jgi:pyocin large subunit-like protein
MISSKSANMRDLACSSYCKSFIAWVVSFMGHTSCPYQSVSALCRYPTDKGKALHPLPVALLEPYCF